MSNTLTMTDTNANAYSIDVPVYGYKTIIRLPFDIQELSKGFFAVYDAGSSYDYRACECEFVMDETDASNLFGGFGDSDKTRADVDVDMELTAGCGFHPFGPDKGDDGTFHVAMELLETSGIGYDPWLHFKAKVRMVNQGAWPSYSLPTEVDEGTLQIGNVSGLRYPPGWPKPDKRYASELSLGKDGTALFADRSTNADWFRTRLGMVCNESKAAALLSYLVGTARANTFSVVSAANHFLFDYDKNDDDTHTARLIQSEIVVTHQMYNRFAFGLDLSWEANP